MPFYKLVLPASTSAGPRANGHDTQIVCAQSAAAAKSIANSLNSSDAPLVWDNATVTELAQQADMLGVTLRCTSASDEDAYNRVYEYTGIAGDKLADLATGLAAVMDADDVNFSAGVVASGLVITIHADNNVGDKTITSGFYVNGVALTSDATVAVLAVTTENSARTLTLAGGTMDGCRLRVTIADPTNPMDLSVYYHDGETIDLAAARLVVLMDAHALIGGGGKVVYSANVITVTGATAAQGAKVITATTTRDGAAIISHALTVNAAGASSINRTITFPADGTLPIPRIPTAIVSAKA